MVHKRPMGRPPTGAAWLEDEGRYEYTQEYFRLREQAFISTRLKAREEYKRRSHIFKDTQRKLCKTIKKEDTLEPFLRAKPLD